MDNISSVQILAAKTTTGAGDARNPHRSRLSFQAIASTTASSGTAKIAIEVSDVPNPTLASHWIKAMEIDLTMADTTPVTDGDTMEARWRWVRANVTTLTGTGASVDVYMGG